MNHTEYHKQTRPVQPRLYSRSGRVCAILSQDGCNWIFPLYRHPGINATESELYAAHMARCVPVQCVERAEILLESIENAVFSDAQKTGPAL